MGILAVEAFLKAINPAWVLVCWERVYGPSNSSKGRILGLMEEMEESRSTDMVFQLNRPS